MINDFLEVEQVGEDYYGVYEARANGRSREGVLDCPKAELLYNSKDPTLRRAEDPRWKSSPE
jgi:hypothetical protein